MNAPSIAEQRAEREYRTEERLGILLQGSEPSILQAFQAQQEAQEAVEAWLRSQDDLQPLKALLEGIYGPRRWQYAEDCLLMEITRSPDHLKEAETIINHYQGLKPARRTFFPQSAYALLSSWHQTLDKARMAERNGSKPDVSLTVQKKAIEDVMKNHPGNPESRAYDGDLDDKREFKTLRDKLAAVNRQIAGL